MSQDKSRSRIANPSPAVSRRNNRVAAIGSNSPAVNPRNQSPSAATTTTKTTTQRRTQSDQRRNEPLPGVTQPPGRNNKRPEPGREPLTLSSLRAAAGNSQPPPPSSREQPPVPVAQSTPKPARKPVKKPAGGGNANKVFSAAETRSNRPDGPDYVDYTSHTLSSSLRATPERDFTPPSPAATVRKTIVPAQSPAPIRKSVPQSPAPVRKSAPAAASEIKNDATSKNKVEILVVESN